MDEIHVCVFMRASWTRGIVYIRMCVFMRASWTRGIVYIRVCVYESIMDEMHSVCV